MIGIIDYGSGNVAAISNIYKSLKIPHVTSCNVEQLIDCERFILPGVGAFDPTMRFLNESGLLKMLTHQIQILGKPILGICVGMQILAQGSQEGSFSGLGWVKGTVKKIDSTKIPTKLKLPHMGWNTVQLLCNDTLFKNVDCEYGFYFLHNYYFDAFNSDDVISTVTYGDEFPCAVRNKNIMGVQFHPEKSHHNGVQIFKNFADL